MMDVWRTVTEDFSDLPSVAETLRLCLRLLIAASLGGLLGYQREKAGKAAGFRTHILVCMGAALFVLIPQSFGMSDSGLSRVIQGVVAGVGFLGAGSIVKDRRADQPEGLTTAAGIWLTAAIGVAAGLGREMTAVLGAIFAFLVLSVLARVSEWIDRKAKK